jgi:hypothetical protein
MIRRIAQALFALLVAVALVVLWMLAPAMVDLVWPALLVVAALVAVLIIMMKRGVTR